MLESSDQPFEIHVIGTPSEESLDGGKNEMAAHGGFDHIDVAFMVHGSTLTQLETPSLALIEMDVEFHGAKPPTRVLRLMLGAAQWMR